MFSSARFWTVHYRLGISYERQKLWEMAEVAFLKALDENKGVLDGTRLFEQIRRPVMVNANQTPQYSDVRKAGHDGGDFLLVRRR